MARAKATHPKVRGSGDGTLILPPGGDEWGKNPSKAGFVFPGLCADFFELMHHHFRTFVDKPCMCLILNHNCDVLGPVDIGSEFSGSSWPPLPFGSGASGQGFVAY